MVETKTEDEELQRLQEWLKREGEEYAHRTEHLGYVVYHHRDGTFTTTKFRRNNEKYVLRDASEYMKRADGNLLQFWIMPTTSRHKALKAAKADHESNLLSIGK